VFGQNSILTERKNSVVLFSGEPKMFRTDTGMYLAVGELRALQK
jgi:hypothetical protein